MYHCQAPLVAEGADCCSLAALLSVVGAVANMLAASSAEVERKVLAKLARITDAAVVVAWATGEVESVEECSEDGGADAVAAAGAEAKVPSHTSSGSAPDRLLAAVAEAEEVVGGAEGISAAVMRAVAWAAAWAAAQRPDTQSTASGSSTRPRTMHHPASRTLHTRRPPQAQPRPSCCS